MGGKRTFSALPTSVYDMGLMHLFSAINLKFISDGVAELAFLDGSNTQYCGYQTQTDHRSDAVDQQEHGTGNIVALTRIPFQSCAQRRLSPRNCYVMPLPLKVGDNTIATTYHILTPNLQAYL